MVTPCCLHQWQYFVTFISAEPFNPHWNTSDSIGNKAVWLPEWIGCACSSRITRQLLWDKRLHAWSQDANADSSSTASICMSTGIQEVAVLIDGGSDTMLCSIQAWYLDCYIDQDCHGALHLKLALIVGNTTFASCWWPNILFRNVVVRSLVLFWWGLMTW